LKSLVLQFRKEKETKGTYRYQELEGSSGDAVVGSLYVRKGAFGDSPPPRAAPGHHRGATSVIVIPPEAPTPTAERTRRPAAVRRLRASSAQPAHVAAETVVRDALRACLLADIGGVRDTFDEFWVPCSHERADLAVIGRSMDGFEIKTERDTLNRLPRQASAYGRLFDRCTVVVAEKHLDRAVEILPAWWGITSISVNGAVTFAVMRPCSANPSIDPQILVRLLWRDEAMAALLTLGREPEKRALRSSLWDEILQSTTVTQLKGVVRHALLSRRRNGPRPAGHRMR